MDILDPNLIEVAHSELAAWTRRAPEVAALASVASLARSVEPELLRALRVGLGARISGKRISVSAESALWFSSFVESRGTDTITLLPEALHVLRARLADDRQLLEDARMIVEDCHKSAPDVLQWEERIVYLALTDQTALLEEEIRRGIRSVSQGMRQPLVSWISDMWLRLPPAATSNPLLVTLYQHVRGSVRRQSPSVSGSESSSTDLVFDFSAFPTRELGVVLRENRFVIGDVTEAEFGIEVPDLNPVELDVAFGSNSSWVEQRKVERGQVAEIAIRNGDTIRVRTLAGQIHELSPAVFLPRAKRFAVALSFAAEDRDFVSKVARELASKVGKEQVLYDKYHEAELARSDLGPYLLHLYQDESELIVIFLREDPTARNWSGLSWLQIAVLLEGDVANRIMIMSFGQPTFLTRPELMGGYVDVTERSPQEVAEVISERLRLDSRNRGKKFVHADISRIMKYAPTELVGREEEMKVLDDAWEKVVRDETRHPHILTFVGLGGEGKTSLVAKWTAELAHRDWPECDAAFAWSFYSQGASDRVQASSDSFLKEALNFFGDSDMANSATGAFEKGQRLAHLVAERRVLLILDGLEPLQKSPASAVSGELKDQGISALLKTLAASSRGLCIITTRQSIADLRALRNTTVVELDLGRLYRAAGVSLLKALGVRGRQAEFQKLVDDVKGHALTLNLIGNYLRDAHGGDIRKRDLLNLEEADSEEFGGSSFRMYAAYIRWLESEGEKGERAIAMLRLLGLFDRHATIESLNALWQGGVITGLTEQLVNLSESQRNISLVRLEETKLLTVTRDTASGQITAIDAHPMLRGYLAKQLQTQRPEAWRNAHRRLYEYFSKTTAEGSEPTLEDLQPLAQAIQSGCQAGLHQEVFNEVYVRRLHRGNEGYVWRKLGAFGFDLGVISSFFEQPWRKVFPALSQEAQPFLLNNAALDLRALGRLTEALEPMRSALDMQIKQSDWKNASTSAGNLCELELTLGEISAAVRDAEQAQSFADRSGDEFQRVARRETLADAWHQAGRRAEAERLFQEAEVLQARRQPNNPLLYSTGGFRYCDLLLGESERAAWRATLHLESQSEFNALAVVSEAVIERASQTLRWIAEYGRDLLSPALDRLTLARAAVYLTILRGPRPENEAHSEKGAAVDGLRRAGQQQYLPHALLTAAWVESLAGTHGGKWGPQSELDEAWEIAERGPMRLHMVDIHLYRARLFNGEKPYPWNKNPDGSERGPKDDLAAARKLIEKCGYWRRKEELEDAEEAAKSWK
jgi:tetratricopeptide (TPR) repeat protein